MDFLKRWGGFQWEEEEAYPRSQDFLLVPLFVLFFPSVRFFLDRFVFEILKEMVHMMIDIDHPQRPKRLISMEASHIYVHLMPLKYNHANL